MCRVMFSESLFWVEIRRQDVNYPCLAAGYYVSVEVDNKTPMALRKITIWEPLLHSTYTHSGVQAIGKIALALRGTFVSQQ